MKAPFETMSAIAGAVDSKRVVESNAVDLEFVDPVDARVPDVLERTSVGVIQIMEERVLGKVPHVRTVCRLLV